MNNLLHFNLERLKPRNRGRRPSILGLSFDAGRLDIAEVRRSNGSVEIRQSMSAGLALDMLTDVPELVGREIRKLLDQLGIRERWCSIAIPVNWALSLTLKLPPLPEEDIASFLQVEAERGFPYGPDALLTACSRFSAPNGDAWVTLIAVPRSHISRLEEIIAAAQLRPAGFSFGISALQPVESDSAQGVLSLEPGENNIRMQFTLGGGIAVLRTIEGAFESGGTERRLQADHVSREVRITLGQLVPELRDALRHVRVFGDNNDAEELAEVLGPRLESQGLQIEQVRIHEQIESDVKLPAKTPVSAALAVAIRRLVGHRTILEFLPPKVSAWQQFTSRYSSPRLVTAGAMAGAVVVMIMLAFTLQQSLLWYWGHRWNSIRGQVQLLEDNQTNIRKYRAWYDSSFRELSILRCITEAFPEDGTVSAKQLEIRDPGKPGEPVVITCTGTARSRSAFLRVKDKLAASRNVAEIHTISERGPEFIFNFQWSEGQ